LHGPGVFLHYNIIAIFFGPALYFLKKMIAKQAKRREKEVSFFLFFRVFRVFRGSTEGWEKAIPAWIGIK